MDQLGYGAEDGAFIMGNSGGAAPIGHDKAIDGLLAVQKTTGKLYWADPDVAGATGIQGVQGITGEDGVQGITGAVGAAADQGITGATGVAGDQGITGDKGVQGITGTLFTPAGGGATGINIIDWSWTMAGGVTGVVAIYSMS
jgi:hypothetical protein